VRKGALVLIAEQQIVGRAGGLCRQYQLHVDNAHAYHYLIPQLPANLET
jgi:hypothetical protein